jgi:regulator of RNase E activity RraA
MLMFAPLSLGPEEIAVFTQKWTGPRCDDGRPRVADQIVERLARISTSDAWGVLSECGYRQQYEGGWQRIHRERHLCGRALTAMFLPRRQDLNDVIAERAEAAGQVGEFTSWPLYALQPGDVYVADVFGKIEWGPVVGDNLCTAIHVRSGRGIVVNGAVRDVEGIARIPDFPCFVRGFHPTYATPATALVGINCPVRLGGVTVMPGDVVLGKGDGLVVIPPHLAEHVASRCEAIAVRDEFAKERLLQQAYLVGQIDRKWTDEIEADFRAWLRGRRVEPAVAADKDDGSN